MSMESVNPTDGPAEIPSETPQDPSSPSDFVGLDGSPTRHLNPYPPHSPDTTFHPTPTPVPEPQPWLPPWWMRITTQVAFVWGLGLGTANAALWRDIGTFGFAGGLILLGTGLRAASMKVFQR